MLLLIYYCLYQRYLQKTALLKTKAVYYEQYVNSFHTKTNRSFIPLENYEMTVSPFKPKVV